MRYKPAAWILAMILLATAVSALGITPGQRIIEFDPNTEHTIQFSVINDGHKDLMLMVYTLGEMNSSISLPMQLVVMPSDEGSKKLSYDVKLPEELSPGDHVAEVVLQEINPNAQKDGVGVQTQLAVATRLIVRVPYPDKFLEIGKIEVMKPGADGSIEFRLPVQNFGEEGIEGTMAEFTITDPEGKNVGKIESQKEHMDAGERTLLKAKWKADVTPGEYSVVAKVHFDDEYKTSKETVFNVGEVDIEVLSIETKNFNLGQVAKVDITMLSKWNKEIEDAYVSLEVKDEEGEGISKVKTPTFNLLPYASKVVPAYWDTADYETGSYYITLEIHFMDKVITKQVVAELSLNQISFGFLGTTGNVVAASGKIDKAKILTVIVILLIAVNVMWFVYIRKRKTGSFDTIEIGVETGRKKKVATRDTGAFKSHDAVSRETLLSNIQKAKIKRKELVHKIQEFKRQHMEDKLTYSEYEYKMNHYLRGKDIDYWKRYYDEYIREANEYLKDIEQRKFREVENPPEGP
ncbi:MAG: hypothetical protein ABIB71_05140 [Candidatus Woesearchaeota archaeon]